MRPRSPTAQYGVTLVTSFNPCCFGMRPRSESGFTVAMHPSGFNPCCFGMRPRSDTKGFASKVFAWFQSLLFWNAPSKTRPSSIIGMRAWCFNPCCFGMRPRSFRNVRRLQPIGNVSILVVLECALEAQRHNME